VHTDSSAPALMMGSHAMGLGAVAAGCRYFAGYPITPQTELLEYMSQALPPRGGVFQQLNDEISSIMACFGAAAAGARTMTASVGPGLTLMIDGLTNAAGAELPIVVGAITRAHVGVSAGLVPAQSDIRMLKGGGNGDYHLPILAPSSCQETAELTHAAFDLADRYRTPVFVAIDGFMANMMEPVLFTPAPRPETPPPAWSLSHEAEPSVVVTSYWSVESDTETCYRLQEKYRVMRERDTRWELYEAEDAEYLLVAFGIMARIAKQTVRMARALGIKAGLFRPITLFPFPDGRLRELAARARSVLVTEINFGQMLVDVRLAVGDLCPVRFHGQPAQPIRPLALLEELQRIVEEAR
jgi:2-oxoglutarate/2-oxoacid ferredoxin oxidoreductase subunit alpha